jgi:peroxiredoxin
MKNRITVGATSPDFTFDSPWETSLRFHDFLKNSNALLIFLRYMGCPLCQLKIYEIKNDIVQFKDKNTHVFIVLQSQPEIIKEMIRQEDMPMTLICDPDMALFKLYNVIPGSIFRYITPGVLQKALRAKKQGFKHGKNEGKELQLPAVFLMDTDKTVRYAYYGRNIGDIPDNQSLLETIAGV